MRVSTTDPITGNDVIDPATHPFVIEGSGENALKILFRIGRNEAGVSRHRGRVDFTHDFGGDQVYVFHCHNLEHEDNDMMVNMRVRA